MVFSNIIKVSGTYMYTVDLAIESPRDVVYKFFAFTCFVFHGAAPIPYVLPYFFIVKVLSILQGWHYM